MKICATILVNVMRIEEKDVVECVDFFFVLYPDTLVTETVFVVATILLLLLLLLPVKFVKWLKIFKCTPATQRSLLLFPFYACIM